MFIKIQDDGQKAWIDFIKGSEGAFELLYTLYHKDMFRYGLQYAHKRELVEDVVHDVFLQIYKLQKKLPEQVNPKAYLFTAMRNTLLNVYKTKEMTVEFQQLDSQNVYEEHNREDEMILSEENKHMTDSLSELHRKLTQKEKQAIYYRIIGNLSYAEISKLMNINEQSAKNIVHRTLSKMRNSIKGLILILIYLITGTTLG